MYVYQTVETKENTHLLIYYYTSTGTRDFMDIKNTFRIYKIKDQTLQACYDLREQIDPYGLLIDAKCTGSGVTFTVDTAGADEAARFCFCAVYDREGRLLGLSQVDMTTRAAAACTVPCDIAAADCAKLFLLDEDFVPLAGVSKD